VITLPEHTATLKWGRGVLDVIYAMGDSGCRLYFDQGKKNKIH
jgi:hypothetical protein